MKAYELFKTWQDNGSSKEDPILVDLKYSSEDLPLSYTKILEFLESLKTTFGIWYDPALPFVVNPDGSITIEVIREEDSATSRDLNPDYGDRYEVGEEYRTEWGGEGPLYSEINHEQYDGEEKCWDMEDVLEAIVAPNEEGLKWSSTYEQTMDYLGDVDFYKGWYEKDTGCSEPEGDFYVGEITAVFMKTWKITISK